MAAEIIVGKNETIDDALRRFKKKCERSGLMAEMKRRSFYEKPSERRKRRSSRHKKK